MQIWLVTFSVTALRGNLGKFAFNVERLAPLSGSWLLLIFFTKFSQNSHKILTEFSENSYKIVKKKVNKQAGAELCQAQSSAKLNASYLLASS